MFTPNEIMIKKTKDTGSVVYLQDDSVSITSSTVADDCRSETPTSQASFKGKAGRKGKFKKCKLQYKCTNYMKVQLISFIKMSTLIIVQNGMFLNIVIWYSIINLLLIMCIDCRKTTGILYLVSSSTTIQKMEIQSFSQLLVPIGYDNYGENYSERHLQKSSHLLKFTLPFRF